MAPPVAVDEVLHRTGDRWVMDLRRLGEPRAALAGARLQPTGDGDPEGTNPGHGFVVSAMDRRGLLARAGIRPGDVLVEVNGAPTLNPDQALEVWGRNQHGRSFAFRFLRGGGGYTVRVEVLNAPAERPPRGLAAAGSRGS
jgi:S1-C subfamily serine protease